MLRLRSCKLRRTGFVLLVGGVKDIYLGIRDGDGWQVAVGSGSIVLDVVTLGSASILKGAVKTGIKAGRKVIAKSAAKGDFLQRS